MAAYSSLTVTEHVPTPADPTKSKLQSDVFASFVKIRTGASIDILQPLTIDASLGLWLPGYKNQVKSEFPEISGYTQEQLHTSEGNFGIEVKVYPKIKLSPNLEWKNILTYGYLNLSSVYTAIADLNGDGDYIDLGEEKNKNTHPFSIQSIGVGTGINYTNNQFFTYVSLNNFTILKGEEWFIVNQATGSDQYKDKEQGSQTDNYTILDGGAEVTLKKWFSLRMGVMNIIEIQSITTTSFGYTGTTENVRDIKSSTTIKHTIIPRIGLSVHFGGFSLDWVISDTFVQNVLGQGSLPYLISGKNLFDKFSMIVSINYKF
ncbi:hypothetical protein [Thermospira aquatica]|uniref:Uncharacterized protein n=1 Tax=Thermospira aquatica TaxID=2828656 RepID=A0AAX3BCS1_9SPIR|nr:hypothetical protein [Thermospira aquatica]URA09781.1 hypothetical protein KDW03_09880 [Thermospira aquatica]